MFSYSKLLLAILLFIPFTISIAANENPTAKATPIEKTNDKALLSYKAKKGEIVINKSQLSMTAEYGGEKLLFDSKSEDKTTVVEVADNGNITFSVENISVERTINGQKLEDEDANKPSIIVIKPNGDLVSYDTGDDDEESSKLQRRLFFATRAAFSAKPVGIGDKWSVENSADDKQGINAGKADYEIVAAETIKGVNSYKIKLNFTEQGVSNPLSTTGFLWVEIISGDVIASELQIDNLPLGPENERIYGLLKAVSERVSGSPVGGAPAQTSDASKPAEATKPKDKTIEEVTKDFTKVEGVVTLYRKKEAGKDTVYLELNEDQLNKNIMLQATVGAGSASDLQAGTPINDLLFYYKLVDDQIFMVVPNIWFRAEDGTPIAKSIKRSFPEGYLSAYKIEAKNTEKKLYLINISDLFRDDTIEISKSMGGILTMLGLGSSYSLDRSKTFIGDIKNFPENLVVETNYHFNRSSRSGGVFSLFGSSVSSLADLRSVPLKVVFNLFFLNDENYQPREADSRIGYFYTEYKSFEDDSVRDMNKRYIFRWHLQKANPAAPLSKPIKPIVFWIDNATPLEYREAVKEGILMWNKAFESAGFIDAVEAKQMPDDADWDIADMRYNTVRWVTSPDDAYAIALFRVNPINGRIMNASVNFDANMTNYSKLEHKSIIANVGWSDDIQKPSNSFFIDKCMMHEKKRNAVFGNLALSLLPGGSSELQQKYTYEYVREVIAHEIGHVLGLRHNFTGSTALTLNDLSNEAVVKERGTSASIMDYTPFNIMAISKPNGMYWTPCVGAYDSWAIQYGYTPFDVNSPSEEKAKLKAIASQCNQRGLAFQTDEDANRVNPYVMTFDLGSEPFIYYIEQMKLASNLMKTLGERLPNIGDSYYEFTQNFYMLMSIKWQSASYMMMNIGGIVTNKNYKGDKGEKPVILPQDPQKQRLALTAIVDAFLKENANTIPKSYMSKLTADPFNPYNGANPYPVLDDLNSINGSVLYGLFNPTRLQRIANNEFRSTDLNQAFTLAFLFNKVSEAIWSELDAKKNISADRRQLQRYYIDLMINLAYLTPNNTPQDARMMAWDKIRTLKARIADIKAHKLNLNEVTRIHLDDCFTRLTKALTAPQIFTVKQE